MTELQYLTQLFNANKSQKLNLAGYTEAKLTLSMPQEGGLYELEDWDYTFNVINNHELQGFSIIYVSLSAKSRKRLNEKPCPPNDKKCRQPRRTGSYIVDRVNSLSQNDAATCTEDNRPPTRPPFDKKDPSIKMNINQVINHERAWFYASEHNYTTLVARSMSFLRMYNNHKMNGIYDVKTDSSRWKGNADMGNFLYGAVMEAHGFSESETYRFSAAYQAVQNGNGKINLFSSSQGLMNFVFNYGDNPEDKAMVSKGFKYAREVNRKGGFVPDSLSCVPTDTVDRSEGGEGGGATSGGGNFFPIPVYVVCYDVCTNGGCNSYCVLQPK